MLAGKRKASPTAEFQMLAKPEREQTQDPTRKPGQAYKGKERGGFVDMDFAREPIGVSQRETG